MKRGAEDHAAWPVRRVRGGPSPWPLLLLALVTANQASGSPAPETEPFERMSQALHSLSYEGILVYSHDNRMETLRIVHRVENGRVHEVLESLNGNPRVMKQDGSQVICRLSGNHLIEVALRALGRDRPGGRPTTTRDLAPYYLVQSQGQARVAERQTEVIGIIPGDDLRYGYRFYLDKDTSLPLKLDLIGPGGRVIEQIMFTSLTLDPAGGPPDGNSQVSPDMAGKEPDTAVVASGPWAFKDVPSGFELVLTERSTDGLGQGLEQFVFSDGLAALSVYVESGTEDGLSGVSRIGAIHAAGGKVAGHQVTVVGEVPAATVEAMLASVRHKVEANP